MWWGRREKNGPGGDLMAIRGKPGQAAYSGHGGAIYCQNSIPLLSNNYFFQNRTGDAIRRKWGDGGNARLMGENQPTVVLAAQVVMRYSGFGGAIYYFNSNAVQWECFPR